MPLPVPWTMSLFNSQPGSQGKPSFPDQSEYNLRAVWYMIKVGNKDPVTVSVTVTVRAVHGSSTTCVLTTMSYFRPGSQGKRLFLDQFCTGRIILPVIPAGSCWHQWLRKNPRFVSQTLSQSQCFGIMADLKKN